MPVDLLIVMHLGGLYELVLQKTLYLAHMLKFPLFTPSFHRINEQLVHKFQRIPNLYEITIMYLLSTWFVAVRF